VERLRRAESALSAAGISALESSPQPPASAVADGPAPALAGSAATADVESHSPARHSITVSAADGFNTVRLRANMAIDDRQFLDASAPASASMIRARHVRPVVEGVLDGAYEYRLMLDLGVGRSTLQEAWINAHATSWLTLQFGKFKTPLGLERMQRDTFLRFAELGLPSSLAPGRDLNPQPSGTVAGERLSYWIGWFDGTLDGQGSENNTSPDLDTDCKRDWIGPAAHHALARTAAHICLPRRRCRHRRRQ